MRISISKIYSSKFLHVFGFIILLITPFETKAVDVFGAIKSGFLWAISQIALGVVWLLGQILTLVIKGIVMVASYNNYIHEETIVEAWKIIRDFSNMFFVLLLLVIAFATILRYESYSIKRLLPKLVIMAVLINFSRMICGIVIQTGQVIMLTFVNAFATAEGTFVGVMQVRTFLTYASAFDSSSIDKVSVISTLGGIMLGVVFLLISAVVLLSLLGVLVIRMVMLLIYVVLSPLAFMLSAFPGGQKYSSQWWGDFVNYVVSGPILAFFIWLALLTGGKLNPPAIAGEQSCGPLEILCPSVFLNFIIAIGMLMGGLIVTSKLGGAVGGAASWGIAKVNAGKGFAKKVGKGAVVGGAVLAGKEIYAQSQKIEAGRWTKAKLQNFKSAGGAATGAAIGSAILPGVGTVVGAGIGALLGKRSVDYLNTRRKNRQKLHDVAQGTDKGVFLDADGKKVEQAAAAHWKWDDKKGRYINTNDEDHAYTDANGQYVGRWNDFTDASKNIYRRINDKGEMRMVDSSGKFIDEKGRQIDNQFDPKKAKKSSYTAMSEAQADRFAGYASVKAAGWTAKDAMADEKIFKLAGQYDAQSKEMQQHLLDIETDGNKRAALAIALALKRGFADGIKGINQVMKAKSFLSNNPLLQKRFDESMNKAHMVVNNAKIEMDDKGKEKVVLDEGAIAKLISSGAANWREQSWATHNEESIKLMHKQMGPDFGQTFAASIRTDKDRETAKKVIEGFVDKLGDENSDLFGIRKAFAVSTGEFTKAAKKDGKVDPVLLDNLMSKISKASDFGMISKKTIESDEDFRESFAKNINIGMLQKMNTSQDIDQNTMKMYVEIIKEKNKPLIEKMKDDNKLKYLVE